MVAETSSTVTVVVILGDVFPVVVGIAVGVLEEMLLYSFGSEIPVIVTDIFTMLQEKRKTILLELCPVYFNCIETILRRHEDARPRFMLFYFSCSFEKIWSK